mgnify:FL=1
MIGKIIVFIFLHDNKDKASNKTILTIISNNQELITTL